MSPFASLAIAISKRYPGYAQASSEDAWDMVNRVCKELFGRTAIEETAAAILQLYTQRRAAED